MSDMCKVWEADSKRYNKPVFPQVSLGWDTNPRFNKFWPGITTNVTPERVQYMMGQAKEFADAHPEQAPLITINSWNEWTETSYLQPDDVNGYGFLEAVRAVFEEETSK